ncbi:putative F-box/FBD/LRR-repeat protein [Raphanus sativus]|uniref:F-box/FBD/LRR-repeat protein At5g56810 n=1 Tax=Raphanus sativus TaxID=3726 RepID=A0A6J0MP14_RAPSA|nr:putative F-box/FBD/LRR-repeat protein At5g56810 [Raphanus sativus]KAJ4907747.1 putative F-box/FBD/LRR-repeat protein [Raphanus sativus]
MEAAKLGNEEVRHSDRISQLPHDLLLRILSLVPVRTAVSTIFISKRWRSVWTKMPTLVYDETCPHIGSLGFDQFCVMYLPLHEAPVLKTLNINLNHSVSFDTLLFPNIRSTSLLKIKITLSRSDHSACSTPIRFPNNLDVFKTLLVLKLRGKIVLDVVDSPVCFPSLKKLRLTCVSFRCGESFKRLLSACPLLEDLILKRVYGCCFRRCLFSILSPSLQRLTIITLGAYSYYNDMSFEISAPSLKYLNIFDNKSYYSFVEDMPKLVEAEVLADLSKIVKFRKVLSPLERLQIRLYPAIITDLTDSLIFKRLLHLELRYSFYSHLLLGLLKYFPKLRSLKLVQPYFTEMTDQLYCSVSVPECLSFHLEILQWSGYGGTQNEREAAVYILKNAQFLKTATISLQKTIMDGQIMMEDLRSISKASASCQLVIESF